MNSFEAKIYDEVAAGLFVRIVLDNFERDGSVRSIAAPSADVAFIAAQEFILARRRAQKTIEAEVAKRVV
jgi:hypothetical protein